MATGTLPLEDRERLFFEDQTKRDQNNDLVISAFVSGTLPTPENIRGIMRFRAGFERERLLSKHPFWKERQLRVGLQAMLDAVHLAYVDICRHDSALTALFKHDPTFRKNSQAAIVMPFQKDVVTYSFLSFGVRDATRKIRKLKVEYEYFFAELFKSLFDNDRSRFFQDLRNNFSHGDIVLPGHVMTMAGWDSVGALTFSSDYLTLQGDWSPPAKRFIETVPEGRIYIRAEIDRYHESVISFRQKTEAFFRKNVSEGEVDFYDLEREYKEETSRTNLGLLLGFLGERDPYSFLDRLFSEDEVREILRRPMRSREQVDLMINLKAVEYVVDQELRQKIYRLFGVLE